MLYLISASYTHDYQESDSQVIEVHGDEPDAFKIMLKVIYEGKLDLDFA
jgi:hypothetical protein